MTLRISEMRDHFENPLYDTHLIAPGQEIPFLGVVENIGNHSKTNMQIAGCIPSHFTNYVVGAIGIRLVGKTRSAEEKLLDHLFATVRIGGTPYGPYPGNLCSTFWMQSEDDEPMETLESDPNWPTEHSYMLPGHILAIPLLILPRMQFALEIRASKDLPKAVEVRGFLLGLSSMSIL